MWPQFFNGNHYEHLLFLSIFIFQSVSYVHPVQGRRENGWAPVKILRFLHTLSILGPIQFRAPVKITGSPPLSTALILYTFSRKHQIILNDIYWLLYCFIPKIHLNLNSATGMILFWKYEMGNSRGSRYISGKSFY